MKKPFLFTSLIIITVLLFPFKDYAANGLDEEIKLFLGQVKLVSADHPRRVAITNPNIADITGVSQQEVTLTPKTAGTTSLTIWDNFGEQSYKVKVFAENITDVKIRIDELLKSLDYPEVYTETAEDEGKVLLLGRVKAAQDREKINIALGSLKDKIVDLLKIKEEETIVEIDVQVLELDKDSTATLGLTNPLSTTAGITITEIGSPGISALGAKWSTLFKMNNLLRGTSAAATSPFSWTLYALIQEGKAKVLSRPRLACQSGKEAELLVGGEKPIFTTTVAATTGAAGTEVSYKEYGIKLKIKPSVTDDERIKLGLNVEVSEVGSAEFIGLTTNRTAQAYPLTKRNAATELYLNNGQTMAIGGLMKQKDEEDMTRTPWLSDLPFIGGAFRKKVTKMGGGSGERGNVELFITLTPTIVSKDKGTAEAKAKISAKAEIAPSPTTPPVITGKVSTAEVGYAQVIQREILKSLSYPSQAKEAGFEGKLDLALHLSYSGELLDVNLTISSGYKVLDDNAIAVARSVGSYPPFPSSIDKKDIWIDIPIEYRLN